MGATEWAVSQQPNWYDDTYRRLEVSFTTEGRQQVRFNGYARLGKRFTLTFYRADHRRVWTVECVASGHPKEYREFTDDDMRAAFGIGQRFPAGALAELFVATTVSAEKFARRGPYLVIPGPDDAEDTNWPTLRASASIRVTKLHKRLIEALLD